MDSISSHKSGKHLHHQPPSSSDLFSSAKVMAEAAQAALHHETNKVDKGRIAGAASNLVDAACYYGKLEEKSFGQYVEKAETYLHQYGSSNSSTSTTAAAASTTSHSGDGHGHSESGYGDYFKMAQGFLKKY
ncbi:hypothetical protein U1Q18_016785 [Sarracenia purpurea var. burkii]